MANKLKIFFLIFALGMFVIPKQILFAQNSAMSCCIENSIKDCCETHKKNTNEKPCHDSDKKGHNCTGCTTCTSCHFVAFLFSLPAEYLYKKPLAITFIREPFAYFTPEISVISGKIWQPPKIG